MNLLDGSGDNRCIVMRPMGLFQSQMALISHFHSKVRNTHESNDSEVSATAENPPYYFLKLVPRQVVCSSGPETHLNLHVARAVPEPDTVCDDVCMCLDVLKLDSFTWGAIIVRGCE